MFNNLNVLYVHKRLSFTDDFFIHDYLINAILIVVLLVFMFWYHKRLKNKNLKNELRISYIKNVISEEEYFKRLNLLK